jgi:lysophospholipase L1-like esterase
MTQQGHNFSLETGEPLLVYHPRMLWRQRPDVTGSFWGTPDVSTNSLGLRQGRVDLSPRRNVLIVGDSVVWGSGVSAGERFSDYAGAELARAGQVSDVQVINAGVIGYSSFQVLQYLRESGLRLLRPAVVVFCAGVNDCWYTTASDRAQYEQEAAFRRMLGRTLEASHLFMFLRRYLLEFLVWVRTGRNPQGFRVFLGDDAVSSPLVLRSSVAETASNVREAGRLVAASGGSLVLILQETRRDYPAMWDSASFRDGRSSLRELARRSGWAVIEMAELGVPPLRASPEDYLFDFCHPTPETHEIIGHRLATELAPLLRSQ